MLNLAPSLYILIDTSVFSRGQHTSLIATIACSPGLEWFLIAGRTERRFTQDMHMRPGSQFVDLHNTKVVMVYRCGSVLFAQGKDGGKRNIFQPAK
jgi:hypothetical protein